MIRFYFDVHVHGAAYDTLRTKGIDILRAQDDNMEEADDDVLLRHATALERVLVTSDKDFLKIAKEFQDSQEFFTGIIFFYQMEITLKRLIDDLFLIAGAAYPDELYSLVTYLPL